MSRHLYHAIVLTLLVPAALAAQTSVTLFQDGRVLVRRTVPATLPRGESVHRFPLGDLDPASIFSLDSAVSILRVSYDAATDEQNTLRRMVGRSMLFHRGWVRPDNADTVRAEILRVNPALYRLADGTVTFQAPGTPVYPADVIQVAPTMELGVSTTRARSDLPLGFFSSGANWSATYTILIHRGRARVSGVASVMSQSFTTDSATVQLLAGQVGRAQPRAPAAFAMEERMVMDAVTVTGGTTEESVGDVHLYSLAGRHTLRPGVTTTIPLFDPAVTATEKTFTIPGAVTWRGVLPQIGDETITPVLVTHVLRRPRRTPFGDLPIPGGVARIYEPDAAGRPQLIGESSLGHTAAGQDLRLGAGQAFDLTARRVQTSYRTERDTSRTRTRAFADYRVTVANAADSAATVEVLERRSGEWTVLSSSVPAEKMSSTETRFRLRVPAGGEAVLTYRVRVTW